MRSLYDFCVLEERLLSELRSQAERFQTQLKEIETAHQAQLRKMETALKAALHSSEEEHGSLEVKRSKKKNKKKKKIRNLERPGGSTGTVAAGDALPEGSPGATALEDVSYDGSISAAAVVDENSSGAGDSGYVSFGAPIEDETALENSPKGEESSTVEAVKEASDGGASEDGSWKVVTSKKKKKNTKKGWEREVIGKIIRDRRNGR